MIHLVGNAPYQHACHFAKPAHTHYDQVGLVLFGSLEDAMGWVAVEKLGLDICDSLVCRRSLAMSQNLLSDLSQEGP